MWYDELDRVTDMARYGNNGGSTFERNGSGMSSPPTRSDSVLVTTSSYDTDGTVKDVTDPRGLVSRTLYDQAGRRAASIANYVDGTPSSATGDDDVYTRFAYEDGHLVKMWSDIDGDGTEDSGVDAVTTYTYGVPKGTGAGDSKISSNDLLLKVIYPEQSGGQAEADRRESFAYNAQGEVMWKKDAAGNIVEMDFDVLGRETSRRATTIASGFDSAVKRITTTYDTDGIVQKVGQYDHATVGSGSIVDEVQFTRDGWFNPQSCLQDRNSAVFAATQDYYKVTLGWERSSGAGKVNTLRNTTKKVHHVSTERLGISNTYDSTGGLFDDDASRASRVKSGGRITETTLVATRSGLIMRQRLGHRSVSGSLTAVCVVALLVVTMYATCACDEFGIPIGFTAMALRVACIIVITIALACSTPSTQRGDVGRIVAWLSAAVIAVASLACTEAFMFAGKLVL